MQQAIILDANAVRQTIKERIAAINRRRPHGKKLSLTAVLREAQTSIHTYYSWGRKDANYSLAKVRSIDAVLDQYERSLV